MIAAQHWKWGLRSEGNEQETREAEPNIQGISKHSEHMWPSITTALSTLLGAVVTDERLRVHVMYNMLVDNS